MKRLIEKRYLIRQNTLAVIGFCLSLYFSYHLIAGHRSALRLMSLESQVSQQEQLLAETTLARETLERRVVMMRPGSIDRDLLEERARIVLGHRKPDERIILQ